jgi:hypothetical protein
MNIDDNDGPKIQKYSSNWKSGVVRQDENAIEHADGTYDNIQVCAHAHYKADGEEVPGMSRPLSSPRSAMPGSNMQAPPRVAPLAICMPTGPFPPAPKTNDGQTVFFFPGMEDYLDSTTIIQPVSGWNADFASAWGIASWNYCSCGTVFEATPVRVNSGETIEGVM